VRLRDWVRFEKKNLLLIKQMPKTTLKNVLRVGTDCSGIEAPIQALIQAKIPFEHVFSSEINKFCIESIKANCKPEILFNDMFTRDISLVPDIDLYVCGFPCQPFSVAGKRKGMDDEKRGTVFDCCLEVIQTKQPSFFLLENVKGLLSTNEGQDFEYVISSLKKLPYNVDWKVLNTRDYGIPEIRE
jgi:DNA (cytosine-5)-methyltransferase 1